ncbi:Thioesterase/thiol ester dehydrase-isomerase [Xylariaceae sp. FL1272]|nr:Thioesterase/thiol ester dehydrase-isomerase [Xylariaceae sp. FL1272]
MFQQSSMLPSLESNVQYFISQGVNILTAPSTLPFSPGCYLETAQVVTGKNVFSSGDTLFRELLNSPKGVPRMLGFCEHPFHGDAQEFPHLPFITSCITLVLELGDGVRGFNGSLHGGVTCAIMDEAMGSLIFQNYLLNREAKADGAIPLDSKNFGLAATSHMNVKYRKMVPTPSIIFAIASLDRLEGRKMHMHVVITDQEGKEYASCDGSFVTFVNSKM